MLDLWLIMPWIKYRRGSRRWYPFVARLATLIALSGPALPAAAAKPEPQQELKELRGRIESLQKQLSASEASRAGAADALRESERGISESGRRLHEISGSQRAAEGEADTLGRRIAAQEARVAAEKARIEKLLVGRYQAGPQDALRLILSGRDPAAAARQLHYYGYISRARAEVVAGLKRDLEQLAALRGDADRKAAQLAELKRQEAEEMKRLQGEQARRQKVMASLADQIARQQKEIGKLRQDEARLTRLVDEIARTLARKRAEEAARRRAEEARRRAREEAEAKKEGKPPPPAPVARIDEEADDSAAGKAFAALKGHLRLPVRGELANRFGTPREAGGPAWKGLLIRAPEGETVKAVADGRVVFADWLRGFGNLLILDHGGGFMTLYGHNEALLKQVGEAIRGGEAIARVGATGGSQESGVYFELRHQSKPLDPLSWIAR